MSGLKTYTGTDAKLGPERAVEVGKVAEGAIEGEIEHRRLSQFQAPGRLAQPDRARPAFPAGWLRPSGHRGSVRSSEALW
jgi:hypothetical protein